MSNSQSQESAPLESIETNIFDSLLAGISQFSNTHINQQFFSEQLNNALDQLDQISDRFTGDIDRIKKHEIKQISRAFRDPALQNTLRQSFDSIQNQITDSINKLEAPVNTNIVKFDGYKTMLGDLGRLSGVAGPTLSIAQINSVVDSRDPIKIGNTIASAIIAAVAAPIATAAAGLFTGGAVTAIAAAGTATILSTLLTPKLLPESFSQYIGDFFLDNIVGSVTDLFEFLNLPRPDEINDLWDQAKTWVQPRRDPLAIDLDGDGIETIGADGSVVFDHDGDGMKTGTGWVAGDDGWLALDRNGNGTIDSGAELFGVDTVKQDGTFATDGFDALADLDSNQDGVFNAQDHAFEQVTIWQDKDQDGITDAGELTSFTAAGIDSINLNPNSETTDLAGGNQQTATSEYTTKSGTQATVANLDLTTNTFYREFTDSIPLTEAAQQLPNTAGSGAVRDLQEAMSLSEELTALVSTYSEEPWYNNQQAQLDTLISAWADTSTMPTSIELASEQDFTLIYMAPGQSAEDFNFGSNDNSPGIAIPDADEMARQEQLMAQQQSLVQMITVLEKFNGNQFVNVNTDGISSDDGVTFTLSAETSNANNTSSTASISVPSRILFLELFPAQIDALTQSYEALKTSLYANLTMQTRLSDFINEVQPVLSLNGTISLDFSDMNTQLEASFSEAPLTTLADLIELIHFHGERFHKNGWDGAQRLQQWIGMHANNPDVQSILHSLNVSLDGSDVADSQGQKILFANDQGSDLTGTTENDTLLGGTGSDKLYGEYGNDTLLGGAGQDRLYGGYGDDTLRGGTGDGDTLYGNSDNDTYLFGRGDGNTTISNYDANTESHDVLRFVEGIAPSDVDTTRSGTNLLLTLHSTGEVITLWKFFTSNRYELDAITFEDGTTWDTDTLKQQAISATEGDDTIIGYASDDTLNALGGNDKVYGAAGNDTLLGGEGDDSLYGDAGNDNLSGGAGRDRLYGGYGDDTLRGGTGDGDALYGNSGNDTYLFGRGDGNTTISNYDTNTESHDVLRFVEGIAPSDVDTTRSGTNLLLTLQSTGEVITLYKFFTSNRYELDAITFEDGTTWDTDTLKQQAISATEGDDTIIGYASDDTLNALGGNDKVYGAAGNDTLLGGEGDDSLYGDAGNDNLSGGAGRDRLYGGDGDDILHGGDNDTLYGNNGSDTYLLANGGGHTTIGNNDSNASSLDVARFEGVSVEDLWFSRNSNHLEITVAGTEDRVTVHDWYRGSRYQLDSIETDSSTLLNSQVEQLVHAMAAHNVPSGAGQVIPQTVQDELQPVLAAAWEMR